MADWRDYLTITLAVFPGAFAWWSGHRLLSFIDDPAINERALARAGQVTQVTIVALVVLQFLGNGISNWVLIPGVIFGVVAGGFRARRRLLDERWGFSQYFRFNLRFYVAWLGFWLLLAASPYFVLSSSGSRTVAALLAALLLIWYYRYHTFFAAIMGIRPLERREFHKAIMERAKVRDVGLFRIPVPGGRLANAWAIPSKPKPAVAFTDTLLEFLREEEQGAILAHELAHLERIAERGRWLQWLERAVVTVLICIGAFGPLLQGIASWMVLIWGVFIFVLLALAASYSRKVEEASDRRAVEICGDPAALERALTKLTLLARFPRRWSLEIEAHSTHPSLANRIRVIREAGGIGAAGRPSEALGSGEIVVAPARGRRFVLLGPGHVELLEGVAAKSPSAPEVLRAQAKRRMSFAFHALADLRVVAGLRERPSLLIGEVTGKVWKIPLEHDAVASVQNALDRMDIRLGTLRTPSRAFGLGARAVALALLLLVWWPISIGGIATAHIASLAAGFGGILSPGIVSLLAIVIASTGLALFHLLTAASMVTVLVGIGNVLVAGVAGFLVFRSRGTYQSRTSRLTPPVFLAVATLAFWGPLAAFLLSQDEPLLPLVEMLRSSPDAWLLPVALASTLLVAARRRTRWA